MLLQTNSYYVPRDKRTEHSRLIRKFRQVMARLGCEEFEVYEQADANWQTDVGGRFIQVMKFRDREHQQKIKESEQNDPIAQDLVREFCEIINFPYQHANGMAATAFYRTADATAADRSARTERRLIPPTAGDAGLDEVRSVRTERPVATTRTNGQGDHD